MSTAGALHCADVSGTFAGDYHETAERVTVATAPLFEIALAHERDRSGLPLEALALLLHDALYGD